MQAMMQTDDRNHQFFTQWFCVVFHRPAFTHKSNLVLQNPLESLDTIVYPQKFYSSFTNIIYPTYAIVYYQKFNPTCAEDGVVVYRIGLLMLKKETREHTRQLHCCAIPFFTSISYTLSTLLGSTLNKLWASAFLVIFPFITSIDSVWSMFR